MREALARGRSRSTSPGPVVRPARSLASNGESGLDDQSRELAAATSGQSDSTIDTKFEPLNGLPTTSVATSAMARASCSSCSRYAGLTLTRTAPIRPAANWRHDPFRHVHRPDSDVLAGLNAERDRARRRSGSRDGSARATTSAAQARETPVHRDRGIERPYRSRTLPTV